MNINFIINQFVVFMNNNIEGIKELSNNIEKKKRDIMLADKIENGFYQFIWEMIVEAQLCSGDDYMDPYGDGADFYGKSSRVTYPEKLASKRISVSVINKIDYKSNRLITYSDLDLIKFINFSNNKYSVSKPLNFVLCENLEGNQFLFRINDVDFCFVNL